MTFYRPDPPPVVDILIRGYGNLELTHSLLQSIRRNTYPKNYEITVIDNGTEGDEEVMALLGVCYVGDWNFVRLPHNYGSCRALNVGMSLAMLSDAPYILLLDNDTEIPKGDTTWLERFIVYLEADPKVGAVGAVTDNVSLWQDAEVTPVYYQRDWKVEGEGEGTKTPKDWPALVSFAMLLRKEACREVGLFDEYFEPGMGEDFDYTFRMVDAGWKCRVANSVWIHHQGHGTFGQMDYNNLLYVAYAKLYEKWGEARLKEIGLNVKQRETVPA